MNDVFKNNINEHQKLFERMSFLAPQVNEAISICSQTLRTKNKIIFCGNGGSASDSQHLASELTGRFVEDREPLAALSLTTDTSALTSIANDYSFNNVFSRQLKALGKEGDCLIALSTSGNSANIIETVKVAKESDIFTICLLGRKGGKLKDLCNLALIMPSNSTARIQEAHIFIGHVICEGIELALNFRA